MLLTFKPVIIPSGRRKDGTWPLYIRVTLKGKSRRLPTTLVCTADDLTRSRKIKNATILQRGSELCVQLRSACDNLPPLVLESWDVDDVVKHIRRQLSARSFRLDFFEFSEPELVDMKPHTKATYVSALNALEAFLGERTLDVNDISKALLREFADAQKTEAVAARHLQKLRHLFEEAKKRYNDEDTGTILIPRSPFSDLPKVRSLGKGQKAQDLGVLQQMIDAQPGTRQQAFALHLFLLSFTTMGANLADLYDAKPFTGDVWIYLRRKTGAEARVRLEPEARQLAALLGAGTSRDWWLPALHHYKSADICSHMANKYLREWADSLELPAFKFYAGRKSWGTLGRKLGIEKATIDEGLAHKGDWDLTDIYAERNWSLAWEANRRVLDLLDWSQLGRSERSQTPR